MITRCKYPFCKEPATHLLVYGVKEMKTFLCQRHLKLQTKGSRKRGTPYQTYQLTFVENHIPINVAPPKDRKNYFKEYHKIKSQEKKK